jgi:hypothetical protein
MLKLVDELLDSVWLVPELEELGLGFIKAGEGVAICVASLASASAAFVASSSWAAACTAMLTTASIAAPAKTKRAFIIAPCLKNRRTHRRQPIRYRISDLKLCIEIAQGQPWQGKI